MKITSGEFKYRNLDIPEGIRPTTEKVREAIFSMVRDWIPDAVVLDLFAGSGAMGLEAISRGSAKCYFNEINRHNYKVLLSNIHNCKADDRVLISNKDYLSCLNGIDEKIDVVFLDPPYNQLDYYEKSFLALQEHELLEDGSIVIAEHLYNDKLSDSYGNLNRIKEKKYGSIGVDVFIMSE